MQFCSAIPGVHINQADLAVTLPNKAIIRLYSGESYDRMRGIYLDGMVMDEPADIDPAAWHSVIRPCLADYQGWGTFIGTPKGRGGNVFWRTWQQATSDPTWFTLLLKASSSGILSESEIEDIKKGTPPHIFEQEFECSFSIGRPGAIYSKQLEVARNERRITADVLWFKELPVYTSFDVGAPQNQKVWIWQMVGDRINFLEALTGDQDCKTPADWAAKLREKQYSYGSHFIPHDAAAEHGGLWQDGMIKAGLSHIMAVPRQTSIWDGINLAQDSFPRIYINSAGCANGLEALDGYHAKEERDGVSIKDVPVHDWSSHYSDAFSLAHQAIAKGLVADRTAIARKPASQNRPQVYTGFRDPRVGGPKKVLR
jgi:hypothetical protein